MGLTSLKRVRVRVQKKNEEYTAKLYKTIFQNKHQTQFNKQH